MAAWSLTAWAWAAAVSSAWRCARLAAISRRWSVATGALAAARPSVSPSSAATLTAVPEDDAAACWLVAVPTLTPIAAITAAASTSAGRRSGVRRRWRGPRATVGVGCPSAAGVGAGRVAARATVPVGAPAWAACRPTGRGRGTGDGRRAGTAVAIVAGAFVAGAFVAGAFAVVGFAAGALLGALLGAAAFA